LQEQYTSVAQIILHSKLIGKSKGQSPTFFLSGLMLACLADAQVGKTVCRVWLCSSDTAPFKITAKNKLLSWPKQLKHVFQ
jgi:hypothetical protein